MPFRTVTTLALLSAVFLSCTKERHPFVPDEKRVRVSLSGPAERECGISTVDVLVFRAGSGTLDCSARSSPDDVSVSVPGGVNLIYHVFANAPEGVFDDISTESDLLSAKTLLSHNSGSGLVMHGSSAGFPDGFSPVDIEVTLCRYACKVTVDRIVPAFKGAEVNAVRFKGAFLLNVCGDEPWSGEPEVGSVWYNLRTKDVGLSNPVAGFVSVPADLPVTDTSAIDADYAFYCLPNPVSDSAEGSGVTRLVLEFDVGGHPDYYPIAIPAMKSNSWYRISNATLQGPGSSDPDRPVSRASLSFAMEVVPWGDPVPTDDVVFDE